MLGHLKTDFGGDTPLAEITASRISEYKAKRLASGGRSVRVRLPSSGG